MVNSAPVDDEHWACYVYNNDSSTQIIAVSVQYVSGFPDVAKTTALVTELPLDQK